MKRCSRCGGSGKVTRGMVINGVCFKCGGDGQHRPSVYANAKRVKIVQYAIVDASGRHLAINTDKLALERLMPALDGAVAITQIQIS